MKKFKQQELRNCNGKNGARTCFAYMGKVYDVSKSFLWRGGTHMVFHYAGEDLSECLSDAPHGIEFLERFPVIGVIAGKQDLPPK